MENELCVGDVLLFDCANPNFAERLILWCESGTVFHAAIYIGANQMVEAATSGVKVSPLSDYSGFKIIARRFVSPTPSTQDDNLDVGTKIKTAALFLVGDKYSYLDDVVDGLRLCLKKCGLHSANAFIARQYNGFRGIVNCSALCAMAIQEATGVNVCAPKDINSITPEDLLLTKNLATKVVDIIP